MSLDLAINLLGQTLVLMPEHALFWMDARTLLVADTHWGKAATFRAAGFAVPGGTTAEGLNRLDHAIDRTGAGRIIFLGDFLHAREGRVPGTMDALAQWRHTRPALDLILVRGNHDKRAGDPGEELGIVCANPPVSDGPFSFAHFPGGRPGTYVMSGHLHPAIRLSGRGLQRARLPCFWVRADHIVLPAFGDFTGKADVKPDAGDRLFAIGGGAVVEIEQKVVRKPRGPLRR